MGKFNYNYEKAPSEILYFLNILIDDAKKLAIEERKRPSIDRMKEISKLKHSINGRKNSIVQIFDKLVLESSFHNGI